VAVQTRGAFWHNSSADTSSGAPPLSVCPPPAAPGRLAGRAGRGGVCSFGFLMIAISLQRARARIGGAHASYICPCRHMHAMQWNCFIYALPLPLSRLSMHEPGASAAPRIICSLWVTGPPSRAAVLFKALISFAGLPLAGQERGAWLNRLQAQARQQGRGCGCGYVSEVLVGVDPGLISGCWTCVGRSLWRAAVGQTLCCLQPPAAVRLHSWHRWRHATQVWSAPARATLSVIMGLAKRRSWVVHACRPGQTGPKSKGFGGKHRQRPCGFGPGCALGV